MTTHRGLEMFYVVVMGLKTAIAHQQKLMDRVFADILWRYVACFVDDLLAFSKLFYDHLMHLEHL